MHTCRYCRHTLCNQCRKLQAAKGAGYCCQCNRTGFMTKPNAAIVIQ
ncbi:MAG: hypothetical protein ACFFCH_03930 [Promethearchaeota archaeon]